MAKKNSSTSKGNNGKASKNAGQGINTNKKSWQPTVDKTTTPPKRDK